MIDIMSKDSLKEKHPFAGVPLTKCLSDCDTGEELLVLRVDAGKKAKNRLANLGIVPGVKIIKNKAAPFHGPVEIIVKGTSLVLGRGLAEKIIVSCQGSCDNTT
jgi:Fe2+ transport system protein FeoA